MSLSPTCPVNLSHHTCLAHCSNPAQNSGTSCVLYKKACGLKYCGNIFHFQPPIRCTGPVYSPEQGLDGQVPFTSCIFNQVQLNTGSVKENKRSVAEVKTWTTSFFLMAVIFDNKRFILIIILDFITRISFCPSSTPQSIWPPLALIFSNSLPPHYLSNDHKTNTQGSSELSCLTTFKLFYAKKGKTKTMWKGITLPKAFKIAYPSAGPLIWDATRTCFPPIKQHVYLLCSPSFAKFTKESHYIITNLTPFTHWITTIADLGKDQVNAGLDQVNSGLDQVNAGLQLKMKSSALRRLEMPHHLGITSVFEDWINLYMKKLYKKHLPNKNMIVNFLNCYRALEHQAERLTCLPAQARWETFLCNSLKKRKLNSSDSYDSEESGIQSDSHTIGEYLDFINEAQTVQKTKCNQDS
ncbi:hypothetical protein VP01_1120g5 [Puccinia sorghi]|uniref:Uncharacterized protein n=1 Tax=Puccinia sorghi TaxID=27349 RepID=A0A0L6VTT1_9BASI|nr:hypothetical protein VP01_1120g5 [Puccinia sorghi]